MKAILHGHLNKPALVVTSTWDPFSEYYANLVRQMKDASGQKGLASVAVLLYPNPAVLINGPRSCPVYMDPDTLVQLLLGLGLDAVLKVHFDKDDLRYGAADFFEMVRQHLVLHTYWLRGGQTLGGGEKGGTLAVLKYTKNNGIVLKVMKKEDKRSAGRSALVEGRIVEATKRTGYWPILSRKVAEVPLLCWAPGAYQAIPLNTPVAKTGEQLVDVMIRPGKTEEELCSFSWPTHVKEPYLAFVQGPADTRVSPPKQAASPMRTYQHATV